MAHCMHKLPFRALTPSLALPPPCECYCVRRDDNRGNWLLVVPHVYVLMVVAVCLLAVGGTNCLVVLPSEIALIGFTLVLSRWHQRTP